MDTEKRLVVASGGGVGGRLGLADVSYYTYRIDMQPGPTV